MTHQELRDMSSYLADRDQFFTPFIYGMIERLLHEHGVAQEIPEQALREAVEDAVQLASSEWDRATHRNDEASA